ncbi:MAG: ATP-binding protein [Sphingomonadaceae bacterium]
MNLRRRYGPITADELNQLLDAGPSDQVAFVTAKSAARTVAETMAALANANGGVILLGVTRKGGVQQGNDANTLRDTTIEAGLLTDPPLILPSAQAAESDRGTLVVLQVPAGLPHIYSLQGLYLTRTGGQNRPLTTPELRSLLLERSESGFERRPVEDAGLDTLDQERVNNYLDYISLTPDEAPLQALLARGCITPAQEAPPPAAPKRRPAPEDMVPTVAGMLLFGRNPQQFLPSAEIICVRYAGTAMDDEFVRQDIKGALAEQIRRAEAFVTSNMRRGMRIAGMAREETDEYPIPVVREAIVNAIAHRDYSIRGEGIRLLLFADRLEIYSPGRLPGHVTLENLKDERYSRNETLVAVLSDLGYIERLGYGIDRMIATMQTAGLPAPRFEETAAGFKVTLYSAGDMLPGNTPETRDLPLGFLNVRQEEAIDFLHQNGRITNSDYQNLCPDVSAETIRRDLADLVEKNLLIRIGSKRATYYILK